MVFSLFDPISGGKALVDTMPAIIRNLKSGFNNFINSMNSPISTVN